MSVPIVGYVKLLKHIHLLLESLSKSLLPLKWCQLKLLLPIEECVLLIVLLCLECGRRSLRSLLKGLLNCNPFFFLIMAVLVCAKQMDDTTLKAFWENIRDNYPLSSEVMTPQELLLFAIWAELDSRRA